MRAIIHILVELNLIAIIKFNYFIVIAINLTIIIHYLFMHYVVQNLIFQFYTRMSVGIIN